MNKISYPYLYAGALLQMVNKTTNQDLYYVVDDSSICLFTKRGIVTRTFKDVFELISFFEKYIG